MNWFTGLALALLACAATLAEPPRQRPRDGDLKEGAAAPDFTLTDLRGEKTVRLSELRGKPVVLIFGSCT
jgi:cytochrome oxidase Cu insertion factor (SCO1/SenC/PrrC family)